MVSKVWDSPEIYCIPVELSKNPLRTLNCYVIRTAEQNLIIDTGFNRPECRTDLWAGLDELRLDLSRTALLLTHLHSDHTGLVWDFVSRGVPVYMGKVDYDCFTRIKEANALGALDRLFEGEGYPAEELALQGIENQGRRYAPQKLYPVIPLEDGQPIPLGGVTAMAIHTPGHTPGHMVLYLPRELLLFSGDHILFDITPNIGVWNNVPRSLSDYIASLQKIQTLPIRATFPAHRAGEADVYNRIDQIIEHHGKRLNEIYETVKHRQGITAYEVSGAIGWSVRDLSWRDFPPHQKWFAMSETLAHLYYLADKKQIFRVEKNSRAVYFSKCPNAHKM